MPSNNRTSKRFWHFRPLPRSDIWCLGLSMNNLDGLTGGLIHLFNHALNEGWVIYGGGMYVLSIPICQLKDLKGVGKKMPFTTFAFVLGGLGMIGVPLTAGFISKWYLVLGAFEADVWWLAILIFTRIIACGDVCL